MLFLLFSQQVVSNSVTSWTAPSQPFLLSSPISRSLLKFMPTESVMLSHHLILYPSLLLPPSIFPTIRVFSNESALHIRWPKYWSFSFSICPSNEILISFRIDWLDLLTVQGIINNLLQHCNWKSSILQHSAFFMVQSPYYSIIFSNFPLLNLSYPSLGSSFITKRPVKIQWWLFP